MNSVKKFIDKSCKNYELLEENEIPVYNFADQKKEINYSLIKYFLKKYGIIIFKNFFKENEIKSMQAEIQKFKELENNKTKQGEECSGDFRLFHVEKKSKILKKMMTDDVIFNNIASFYRNPTYWDRKLLLNKVVYNKDVVSNSGGGWHRDNHHCQFKTLVYMSNVELENGNFQFIVNSTIKDIGIPSHWSYDNTRYADETINNLLKDNNDCKLYDIIGEAGTVVFFDSTNIHRGKVIEKGERVALTQYYFT